MFFLKDGVDDRDVHPNLWAILGALAVRHVTATGMSLVVTSLRRPPTDRDSFHSPPEGELVRAADIRRRYLDKTKVTEHFARSIRLLYSGELDVVLEPEWLTPEEIERRGGLEAIDPHLHLELIREDWQRVA